ncbi:hypothetical protein [Xylanibacillus composti]|uniref:hypothetical protein n=1 Tax=Xylanibacillus composti TaxID=1572762 RepID=UPI001BCE1B3F|nr:hypothetical protein [Xylanibacillus composti]
MKRWSNRCQQCAAALDDHGRYQDQFGPYAPYRPIDDLRLTNGIPQDAELHRCVHQAYCPQCGNACLVSVAETSDWQ